MIEADCLPCRSYQQDQIRELEELGDGLEFI